ncbi:MAG: ABC transporter ATP-binding protein [Clostridiales bacterium]|nr:ABC transporter ATP-binding protein [Clostridiales bacterium]
MKKLLCYLKNYIKETVLGPLFKLLEALFELVVPLVVAKIIDVGIKQNDSNVIIVYSIVLICLGIVGLISAITAQYFAAKAAIGFATKIRSAVFEKFQAFSYSTIDKLGKSKMVTTITNDINQIQTGVNLTLRLLLRSPFIVFGSMVMAYIIDPSMSIIFIVMIPLLFISVFAIMKITIPRYRQIQENLDSMVLSVRENINGVRVIRAFGSDDYEKNEFLSKNKKMNKLQNITGVISSVLNPLTFVIVNFCIIALVWFGALKVDGGYLSQGQVIALYGYLSQILVELLKLANLIVNVSRSFAAGDRVESVLEIKVEDVSGGKLPSSAENAVEFRDVSLKYENSSDFSLEHLSFIVPKGSTVGIVGGTGSGKTSLVNLIPGFYKATEGEVLINGKNINEISVTNLRERIGIVPQKSVLFKGTIRENMLWGKSDAADDEIYDAIKTAQASDVIDSRPDKLDAFVSQNGENFSGGQRQRLCIARALVKKPDILILDDSSSALDYLTDRNLRKALRDLDDNMTIFIVSQRTSAFSGADMIIVLDDGQISGIGTHDELLETCPIYKEIYDSQFSERE